MSKTLDKITIEETIKNALNEMYQLHEGGFDFETESNYVPYGDTYVSSGNYITEESQIKCEEAFKQDFDVDYFIKEYLIESKDFCDKIKEMVENGDFLK